jgi:serine/threonine protein kinase/thioredoxin-like negative regulator of GroEL
MPFANGENVGAYRIVEKLGQGGMATVFKAYHPALDRYVAIKVMHPVFMEDPNFLARFQREARIVAKLDHPHIVPIYDFAEHNGHPYLVMRFVEGETLKARLQRGSPEPQEVMRIAQAVGGALTYAHGQGVLHRDIKPSNVLLTPDGGVYLTDFGLARMAEAGESTLSRDMMVGTPQYISPEQAKGLTNLDARTDIYSFGVVLYEMLVGRAPFTADTPYAIVHDHIFTPLPLPRELNPNLPEPLERVLLRALAKEPDDRFQSVDGLIGALEITLKPTPPPPPETIVAPPPEVVVTPPPAPPASEVAEKPKAKRRWPWIVAAVAAIAVCIVGFLCLVAINQRHQNLLEEARAAREAGDLEYALELYEEAIRVNPRLVPAYVEASEVLIEMGDVEGAMEALSRGIEANPNNPGLHVRLGGIAILAKRWDVAEMEMQWMLDEMPEEAISHAYAGMLALAQGKPCQEARRELESALVIDPELAWAHFGMAYCFQQEGDFDAARAELELVLRRDDITPLLRTRAEEMMRELDQALEEPGEAQSIEQHFELIISLSGEIPDDELRRQLKDQLDHARRAWEEGNRREAIQLVKDTIGWIRENREAIGEPIAGELIVELTVITRKSDEAPTP